MRDVQCACVFFAVPAPKIQKLLSSLSFHAHSKSHVPLMTRVSNTPTSRPEVIQSLIDGVDRYNPDNVSILEEYLATQCSNREVDALANLAILKL